MPSHDRYSREREKYLRWRKVQQAKERALLDELKASPCLDCGQSFPPECMDFDHVRGKKSFSVNTQTIGKRWEAIRAELEKCDLVCSNCHRMRTRRRLLGG